jgi:iron complex outermembrane receptor protein
MNTRALVALLPFVCLAGAKLTQAAAETPNPESPAGLEEIIVTAQKHSEDVQSTPMAVTVLDPNSLANKGVTDLLKLNNAVPGLAVDSQLNESVVFLRGIGPEINFPQNGSAIPFLLDGADVQREALATGLFDVAQIEVLRGPQGTLYGRNAIGGVINIESNHPTDEFGGAAEVEAGDYSLIRTAAMLNLPFNKEFAMRAAFQTVSREGYLSNNAGALRAQGGRIEALYKPADQFDLLVVATIGHQGGLPTSFIPKNCGVPLPSTPQGPLGEPTNCGSTPHDNGLINSNHPWNTTTATAGTFVHEDNWSVAARANYHFDDGVTLTFVPSFAHATNDQNFYNGNAEMIDEHLEPKEHAEELRLANSPGAGAGALLWIVGLYDFGQTGPFIGQIHPATAQNGDYPTLPPGSRFFPPFPGAYVSFLEPQIDLKSYAAFGQLTYSILDTVRATGGLRYSEDKASGATGSGPVGGPIFPPSLTLTDHNQSADRVDWKVGLEADVTKTSMLYANVQTGYLQGGFSLQGNFKPETLLAFSVGSKNRFLDNRLEFNAEGYYYDYKDYQLAFTNSVSGQQSIYNAPRVHIYGADFSLQYKLSPSDKIDATLALLHTEIIDFVTPQPTTADMANTAIYVAAGVSLAGYRLLESPEISASIGYEHDWYLPSGGMIAARVDDHHESSHYGDIFDSQSSYSPTFDKTNVTLNYTAASDRWHAGVYVLNIQDAASFTQGGPLVGANILAPRTFGAKIGVKF